MSRKWSGDLLFVLVCASLGLSTALAQDTNVGKMKITFAGSEVGFNRYESKPDGTFESVSEMNLGGLTIKSKLIGKFVEGTLVEFELAQSAMGEEATITAKEGKVKIVSKAKTTEKEYQPAKLVFANFHPLLSATVVKALDPSGATIQTVEPFLLDGAMTLKADLSKKKTRTIEVGGEKQVVEVYLIRFSTGVDIDLYLSKEAQVVAWDVPSQKLQIVATGYENLLVDPTTLYPELSQPTMRTKTLKGVKIKMRDGVELVADLAMPDEAGKYPAILVRTPYGRESAMLTAEWWAKRGYVYIAQDVRGRNESGGEWNPFFHERKDGYDTIDWIVKQPWSNGKVGMIGASYVGWVQWWAAVEAHPALKCIVPQVSPPDPFFNFPYDHGIPMLYGAIWWTHFVKEKKVPLGGPKPIKDVDKFKTLPLSKVDDVILGTNVPFYDKWLEKEMASAFAGANYLADLHKVKIPVLHISGWWDGDGIGTKMNWARLRALGHTKQWLIYGPWTHAFNTTSRVGDIDYGPDAILELDSIYLRWFDHWLKGKPVGWEKQPKVRIFVTGVNEWRELQDWPDPRSKERTLYLSSQGPANGKTSLGELVPTPPKEQEPDRYTYNPANDYIPDEFKKLDPTEVSTVVKIEPHEEDVLLYKTAPMTEPLEIGGPIELELYFSTTAKDTDFFAVLVDVDEKGEMRLIGLPGKIRAKYLSGWDKPSLLKPGGVYKATLALWDTAHQIKKGHRLGLLITSDMFPMYARNLNTGEPIKDATRMVAAHQTIYHDAKRPSALRFRVLPKKE